MQSKNFFLRRSASLSAMPVRSASKDQHQWVQLTVRSPRDHERRLSADQTPGRDCMNFCSCRRHDSFLKQVPAVPIIVMRKPKQKEEKSPLQDDAPVEWQHRDSDRSVTQSGTPPFSGGSLPRPPNTGSCLRGRENMELHTDVTEDVHHPPTHPSGSAWRAASWERSVQKRKQTPGGGGGRKALCQVGREGAACLAPILPSAGFTPGLSY